MLRFVHSADWQLGARFAQFGSAGERLRAQRLLTLRRALEAARAQAADAFLVAGDLFEDNLVGPELVEATLAIFAAFPEIAIGLLPGNHDPQTGPGAVWQRPAFREGARPANVQVYAAAGAYPLQGHDGTPAVLLASPLTQKSSFTDPSLALVELARAEPLERIKIGLTHGALAIPGKHQPGDFPIDVSAATRAGLDYLGLGHWHNWQEFDGGRLIMPGTPEPDGFGQENAGRVALVEIDGPGAPPRVRALPVAGLCWLEWTFDLAELEAARPTLDRQFREMAAGLATAVSRMRLTGPAAPARVAAAEDWLRARFRGAFHFQWIDATYPALTAGELAALSTEHPILEQVLADLRRMEFYATGTFPEDNGSPGALEPGAIPLPDAQALAAQGRYDLGALMPADFAAARRLLFAALHDAPCAPGGV